MSRISVEALQAVCCTFEAARQDAGSVSCSFGWESAGATSDNVSGDNDVVPDVAALRHSDSPKRCGNCGNRHTPGRA